MRIAILAPGPSLAALASRPPCDCAVGINRAATAFWCDVWVALDYPTVRDQREKVLGSPLLLSLADTWKSVQSRRWWSYGVTVDSFVSSAPAGKEWLRSSAAAAVVYALSLVPSHLDLYGMDWAGVQDFDGVKAGENRSEDRWADERRYFLETLIPFCASRGVVVVRNEAGNLRHH